jgi:hypothetical protein
MNFAPFSWLFVVVVGLLLGGSLAVLMSPQVRRSRAFLWIVIGMVLVLFVAALLWTYLLGTDP